MIENNIELNDRLKKFCEDNNMKIELFELAIVGKGYGTGDRKRLYGPKNVKNENCVYVIKLFTKYNIIVIWNYRNNTSMSFSYMTLKEKLDKKMCRLDKGEGTHPHNQSEVLFEYTENFERLLNIIADKI